MLRTTHRTADRNSACFNVFREQTPSARLPPSAVRLLRRRAPLDPPDGPPSYQAADFAAFFFALGSGATAAFRFAFGIAAFFAAAQRLICACRMRSRASALSIRRFLTFPGVAADA